MVKFLQALYEDASLYVRQSAWLNAVPERANNDKGPRISRLDRMRKDRKDDEFHPEMPPIDAWHLIGYLFEIGPTMAAGSGSGPITNEELCAWMDLTGVQLQPWESRFLRRLSIEYLVESNRAEKPNRPAPWSSSGYSPDLSIMAKSMQESIRALANL